MSELVLISDRKSIGKVENVRVSAYITSIKKLPTSNEGGVKKVIDLFFRG